MSHTPNWSPGHGRVASNGASSFHYVASSTRVLHFSAKFACDAPGEPKQAETNCSGDGLAETRLVRERGPAPRFFAVHFERLPVARQTHAQVVLGGSRRQIEPAHSAMDVESAYEVIATRALEGACDACDRTVGFAAHHV